MSSKKTVAALRNDDCWFKFLTMAKMKKRFTLTLCLSALVTTSTGQSTTPRVDDTFFTGNDLDAWSTSQPKYWSVKGGTIVGHSTEKVPKNEFLWSDVTVKDFYLSVDVKLTPDNRNAGIQFRSKKTNAYGQALGYQADVGAGVWGKLYHEHGRGKLDWNNRADKAVKRGEWNRYEILAVGHRIWSAINGTLCVAIDDPKGELAGDIAFQLHAGPAQTVLYRPVKLIHNPKLALDDFTEKQLLAALPKKAVAAPPSTPVLTRPLAKAAKASPGFRNGFQITGDANIVIVGSTNAAESQGHGYLETLLTAAHPKQRLSIRNMAWPADTVYQQQRPRNFFGTTKPSYGEADRRKPLAANMVFVWLGQAESLEGFEKLDDFTKCYEQILEQLSSRTSRLVLITPVPFEDPLGLGLDIKKRNANLKHYTSAILRLGQARKLPVVDLTSSLLGQAITRDGATLSRKGQWLVARTISTQLGLTDPTSAIRATLTGELIPIPAEELRQTILRKNMLWRQFWLPTNWAFLYGNRQTQPSSRDHNDSAHRWFPEEVQSIVPQLEQMDSLIQGKARLITD
jgi:hypothetical protein